MSSTVPAAAASATANSSASTPAETLPIYLDYNATTPLREEVVKAMQPFLVAGVHATTFGNPSSSHVFGRSARTALDGARISLGSLLGAKDAAQEIVFTSGATESLNYAIQGAARSARAEGRGNHIISTNIEHVAVLEILQQLVKEGWEVTLLPVDAEGRVSAQQVRQALRPITTLVTVMLANNEVGSVNPLADISKEMDRWSEETGSSRPWLHTDASQAVGKHAFTVDQLGVDLLTVAGHKLYAPKGVGALYVRASTVSRLGSLAKFMLGANHEKDRRAGTENVLLAVGLGAACHTAQQELKEFVPKMGMLRKMLLSSITSELDKLKQERKLTSPPSSSDQNQEGKYSFRINGPSVDENKLSNTLSIGFRGIPASSLLERLSSTLVASAGAACHSGAAEHAQLSYVLTAMKVPQQYGMGTLRLSVGHFLTVPQALSCGRAIARAVVDMWAENDAKEYDKVPAH